MIEGESVAWRGGNGAVSIVGCTADGLRYSTVQKRLRVLQNPN